jgi:hypothetical protein
VKTFVDGGYRMRALVRAIVIRAAAMSMIERHREVRVFALLVACGGGSTIAPWRPRRCRASRGRTRRRRQGRKRMVPTEAFLRAYLTWFGLAPDQVGRARGNDLFDRWVVTSRHSACPTINSTRRVHAKQHGHARRAWRLGERCASGPRARSARRPPIDKRVVFAFDARDQTTRDDFIQGSVLHRTFLGYPARLAPASRRPVLPHRVVASRHTASLLTPDELGWAAVCGARPASKQGSTDAAARAPGVLCGSAVAILLRPAWATTAAQRDDFFIFIHAGGAGCHAVGRSRGERIIGGDNNNANLAGSGTFDAPLDGDVHTFDIVAPSGSGLRFRAGDR